MDKQVPALIVGLFVLVAGGILAAFLMFMQPNTHEPGVRTDAAFHFPVGVSGAQRQQAAEGDEGTAQMLAESAPAPAADPAKGSLGFLKKDASVLSGPGGAGGFDGGSKPSSDNPADIMNQLRDEKGDIPGVEGSAEKMPVPVTYALMERVVGKVKSTRPKWYQEFLGYKDCKALADRYYKGKDFKGFVKDLHRSQSFHGMLKKHYKTDAMKGLTKSLLNDQSTGPQLLRLFAENIQDSNMLAMVKAYGKDAGLPPAMVAQASTVATGLQMSLPRHKAQPAAASRPRLKSAGGFNSGFGGKRQGSAVQQQGQLPEGVDPEMVKKLQQQYMGQH